MFDIHPTHLMDEPVQVTSIPVHSCVNLDNMGLCLAARPGSASEALLRPLTDGVEMVLIINRWDAWKGE